MYLHVAQVYFEVILSKASQIFILFSLSTASMTKSQIDRNGDNPFYDKTLSVKFSSQAHLPFQQQKLQSHKFG